MLHNIHSNIRISGLHKYWHIWQHVTCQHFIWITCS
jgi:hypothetical protein